MGTRENMFSELLEFIKSWLPRHSEPAYVSRDFWMPDNSCRVCYDCDVQFTIFVRKHHCRLCGRVFCGKCTANSIPVPSADPRYRKSELDRVRVCNFCLQQWQQEVAAATNSTQTSNSGMDHSFSTVSTGTSDTPQSSSITVDSMSYSNEPFQQVSYESAPSPVPSEIIEHDANKQDVLMLGMHANIAADFGDTCSNYFSCSLNRSDYYDDMHSVCHSDSEAQHFQYCEDYYGRVEYDDLDHKYYRHKVNHAEEHHASENVPSLVGDSTKSQDFTCSDKVAEEGPEHGNDYGISSSIYDMECVVEPVDFENNGLLWLPPEPEDEEDENEALPIDDEDDYALGEWGYLRSSKSFGSCEYRNRDQSSDEQRRALKRAVGGHFRALIAQLIQVENLPIGEEGDKESWLEIITSLSWEAATLLKPDTSRGGGMDPCGYAKVKCVACGHRSQSAVVRGVVCKKNVAHRHMMSNIAKPRLLILGGALEYQRVMNLSSFDTLLQQEMDHLKMAVARIDSQHPHVLLVEKSVSRFAQDYLLAKDISVVLNVKRSLLQRISRCTGAQIVPSIDHLSSTRLGHCDLFHVERFVEEHGSAGKDGKKLTKTLMFFEECPRPLGCTILLKGANGDELKKVKRLVKYGIFAAYHLALETSFLADEGASLLELPSESPITVALPDIPSCIDRSIFTVHDFASNASDTSVLCNNGINANSALYTSRMIKPEKAESHLSHSSSVSSFSTEPGDNERLHMWNFSQAMHAIEPQSRAYLIVKDGTCTYPHDFPGKFLCEKDNICFQESPIVKTISNDVQKHTNLKHVTSEDDIKKENQACISDIVNVYQDNGQLQESIQTKDEFLPTPSDHQSILVSLSSRCVWKGTVCERSHLFRIKYYGSFDKPLGRFLRDHLFDECYRCTSCEMPSEAHIHCYTHQQGSLTISVRKLPEFHLNGERDGRIWMWHRCLRCPRVNGFPPSTRRIVMSDAAWGLSFGKFLELSFSNHAAASRVASCGHSLHRDCLRFYGLGKMVACFRYASINVHSVCLPSHKLDFNYKYQDWVQKEANEVDEMKKLLFTEVLSLLGRVAVKNEFNHYVRIFEEMQQKEKKEFEESLNKLLKKEVKKGEPDIDILEITKLKRQLVFQSYIWDQRLICATGCKYRPPEFLCSFFTDNEKLSRTERLDVASKVRTTVVRIKTSGPVSRIDETINDEILESHIEEPFDEPKCWDLYRQKTDPEVETSVEKQNKTSLSTCVSEVAQLDPLVSGLIERRTLSDGQFPLLTNISDTFDAKWRGENRQIFSNLGTLDSSASVDQTVVASNDTEEKGIVDITQSSGFVCLGKLRDSTEDFSSWIGIPFLNLYHFFNKSLDNSPRFGALNKYNPVYVSFFRELERWGVRRSLLPIGENEIVIPVYADEPTSVICYSLVSADYYFQMSEDREKTRDFTDSSLHSSVGGSANLQFSHSIDEVSSEVFKSFGSTEESILSLSGNRSSLDPVSYTKTMHARISFEDDGPLGKVKYTVICYFAKHFDALRRICCPSELDFIRSLNRCKKWGAQGGKSNVYFAKSLDDRFIIKQVTKTEIESFMKFAPEYFKYLSESITTRSPTCLAKILGIYQVSIKHLKGGKDTKMDILIMENLLFGRTITRLYDLKGSSRSRYNPDSKGNNKVLLDQNLIEAMPTSPIFVDNKAKRLLERAVWNDTSFLASMDVMDYSLLVGVDEVKNELVAGIIDFMRQYTWDKHLETWVKASGILGGPKNVSPTVISPKQYKKRFRKAMSGYFLVIPDQWSSPPTEPTSLLSDFDEFDSKYTSQKSYKSRSFHLPSSFEGNQ